MLTVRGNIKVTGNLNLKTADAISIVTSGLVFYVSAAESTSYPGSGTTWTDISTNSNNGTLTNGPTFDSGDGGSIVFDGTDDYVELGSVDSSNPAIMRTDISGIAVATITDNLGCLVTQNVPVN